MLVEILHQNPFSPAAPTEDEFQQLEAEMLTQDLMARTILSDKLGLRAQSKIFRELFMIHSLRRLIPYPFLTKPEENILNRIFPTHYQHELSPTERTLGYRTLASYAFDLIPPFVLAEWADCVDRQLFSAFEIWTPEKLQKPNDPVLIGRRREHDAIYVIARWGAALRPFEELAKEAGVSGMSGNLTP